MNLASNTPDYRSIWSRVLDSIRGELDQASFDTWFNNARYNSSKNDVVYITVPNILTKEWIEVRYFDILQETLRKLSSQKVTLALTTETEAEKISPFNQKYTFENFVVGNSNRFAHAACYAVAESPSRAYNPLFIYGGVGLGKTHLMHAICHHILENNPGMNVTYISSEQFTNELISSIKDDTTGSFRNKYRNIDVLLIDDIQFLAGKERTQEEFFHTFNTLYESNKQLIISSDRPPKNIPTLEDRLRSRFEWGLITDIQTPDLETRIAILRQKAQDGNLNVPYDILDYIASYIDSNIRELEGALITAVAYSRMTSQTLSLELAAEALKDILPPPGSRQVTIEMIQKTVCKHFDIDLSEMLSKKRNKQLVFPRQVAMYLCRKMTDASLPVIGSQFGGRDHTTVIHSIEKIDTDLKTNPQLSFQVDRICQSLDPDYR